MCLFIPTVSRSGPFSKEAHFLPLWAGLDELSSLP